MCYQDDEIGQHDNKFKQNGRVSKPTQNFHITDSSTETKL